MGIEQEVRIKLAKSDRHGSKVETIREHTDALLNECRKLYDLNYISLPEYTALSYACEKHDYGKVNEPMQQRIKSKYKRFDEDIEVQHNILSALFVHREDFEDEDDFLAVLYAVLYHHDNRDESETLASMLRKGNNLIDSFEQDYKEFGAEKPNRKLLKRLDKISKYRDCDDVAESEKDIFIKLTKLKGLLHKCDYSASAHINCEYPNDFMMDKLNALLAKFAKLNNKNQDDGKWNELQQFTLENSDKNLIITAPTGSGKTEAGLLWAGNNKCFFVLPLKTAINAMYARIKNDIIGDEYVNERVALLHSDMQSFYVNDSDSVNGEIDMNSIMTYTLRSRQMSLPITVATLDQIFDFTLKFYGYEYKLSTLSYSKVIIDEIQMYSPDLLAYLIFGIKKIVEIGGKVAVLTATLPPFVKEKLIESMGKNLVINDFSYMKGARHNVKVCESQLNSDDIVEKWHDFSGRESRKFLVICNSIKTAQRIFEELGLKLQDNVEINLLHSNFTKKDRAEKEEQVKSVGRTYEDEKNGDFNINCSHQIWVATSVVEASLDIDFDFLFTELLELFSLFQRFGRVNRKGKKEIIDYNCFVYTELQDGPLKCYGKDGDVFKFVDDKIYDLSREAVSTINGVISETDKKKLIDEYLSLNNIEGTYYAKKYIDTYRELEKLYIYEKGKCQIRDIENIDIIPSPVYDKNQEYINQLESILKQENSNAADRVRAMDGIRDFTVSVNIHRVNIIGNKKRKTKTLKNIKFSNHFEIPVVCCEYNDKIGLGEIFSEEKKKIGIII